MEETYAIHIMTVREMRTVTVSGITLDEAVSIGMVFFDKFATSIADNVLVSLQINDNFIKEYCPKRMIMLTAGLKTEITVFTEE